MSPEHHDVVIIGGGQAVTERSAALAASVPDAVTA
jgi:hypothetical protein